MQMPNYWLEMTVLSAHELPAKELVATMRLFHNEQMATLVSFNDLQ